MRRVNYQVIREDWGEYELPNQVFVRARVTLTHFCADPARPAGREIGAQVQVDAIVPSEMRTTPPISVQPYAPETRLETYRGAEIRELRQGTSLYVLEDGAILTMKLEPDAMHLHAVRTNAGDPVVEVESQTVFSIAVPPNLAALPPNAKQPAP